MLDLVHTVYIMCAMATSVESGIIYLLHIYLSYLSYS